MIQLAATTDKLQLVTDAAVTVDVHVSFMDASMDNPPVVQGDTSSRQNTAISTATTTDILAAPGASTLRNAKTINIRNKHASTSVGVTVVFDQNGTDFELVKVILLAGQTLEYVEGVGWYVVSAQTLLDRTLRVAGSDYVNATTGFTDITGLTCPVESGKHYNFLAALFHIENASTTGARFAINGPSMTGMRIQELGLFAGAVGAGTMQGNIADVTALDTAAVAATSSAGTPQVAVAFLTGWINPSASGTFAVRGQSEVAVAAGLTVKVGSWCRIWEPTG